VGPALLAVAVGVLATAPGAAADTPDGGDLASQGTTLRLKKPKRRAARQWPR
jgi:hypothetical protein